MARSMSAPFVMMVAEPTRYEVLCEECGQLATSVVFRDAERTIEAHNELHRLAER